jgi:hypothetical protein
VALKILRYGPGNPYSPSFLLLSFFLLILFILYFYVLCPCPVGFIPEPRAPPLPFPLPLLLLYSAASSLFLFHMFVLKSLFAFLSPSFFLLVQYLSVSLPLPSGLYNGVRCVLFLVVSGWLYFLHAGLLLLPCCLLSLSPPLHPCIQQGLVSVLPVSAID